MLDNFILFYFPIKNILSDFQNLKLFSSEVEEALVCLKIDLLRSSQSHTLVSFTVMEGSIRVLIIVVRLFPEVSKERAVPSLPFSYPEVLMDLGSDFFGEFRELASICKLSPVLLHVL